MQSYEDALSRLKKSRGFTVSPPRKTPEYKLTHKGPAVINTRTTRARLHKLLAKEEEQKRGGRMAVQQRSEFKAANVPAKCLAHCL